ncbi:FKBP-type peptidyl-prolyl cis-trans isomerase, partial [Candidatus Uhrbacteria bacterium]|nr:FKBP-type peptidyl-prolyl cis-trans isomerase [Candidatus Uhrbacteria bacterium]
LTTSGVYSGSVSGHVGPATVQAIQKWQSSHSLVSSGDPDSTGYGYVGPLTRDKMHCATTPVAVNPPVSPVAVPQTPGQVQSQDVTIGTGKEAVPGTTVSILYVGKLPDGTIFDSSASHGNQPLTFSLGGQGIIPGFQIGVNGMKEGGERIVTIPSAQGYGSQDVSDGNGKVIIPANSTLVFDIKLVSVSVGGGSVLDSLEQARMKGRDARRVADIKQLQLALELYYDSNGAYPSVLSRDALVTKGFISAVPTDPSTAQPYQYAGLGSGTCSGYHLGARLEIATSSALSVDSDGGGTVTCTGSAANFYGTDPIYDVQESADDTSSASLESKRALVSRALAATEPSLLKALKNFIQDIRTSTVGNIPTSQAFAAQWGDRIVRMNTDWQSMQGTNLNTLSAPQLDSLLAKLTGFQGDKQNVLAAYNAISTDELERIEAGKSTVTLATYMGYLDGALFITTANISRDDALSNCKTNAANNPARSARCTWGGVEIYTSQG